MCACVKTLLLQQCSVCLRLPSVHVCVCFCVFSSHLFWTPVCAFPYTCGRTNRGHTAGLRRFFVDSILSVQIMQLLNLHTSHDQAPLLTPLFSSYPPVQEYSSTGVILAVLLVYRTSTRILYCCNQPQYDNEAQGQQQPTPCPYRLLPMQSVCIAVGSCY